MVVLDDHEGLFSPRSFYDSIKTDLRGHKQGCMCYCP